MKIETFDVVETSVRNCDIQNTKIYRFETIELREKYFEHLTNQYRMNKYLKETESNCFYDGDKWLYTIEIANETIDIITQIIEENNELILKS